MWNRFVNVIWHSVHVELSNLSYRDQNDNFPVKIHLVINKGLHKVSKTLSKVRKTPEKMASHNKKKIRSKKEEEERESKITGIRIYNLHK